MYEVYIIRLEMTNQGALGVMLVFGEIFCITLEPDKDEQGKLYIPAGRYRCKRFNGKKWPNTFEIIVPGHTAVLFHSGNVEADTRGCVLLGSTAGKLKGQRAVLNSGATFQAFLDLLRHRDSFGLGIKDNYFLEPGE